MPAKRSGNQIPTSKLEQVFSSKKLFSMTWNFVHGNKITVWASSFCNNNNNNNNNFIILILKPILFISQNKSQIIHTSCSVAKSTIKTANILNLHVS